MYQGNIALVVGGAQGTGRACCEALVAKGAKVCIGDIVEDAGRDLETKLNHDLEYPVAKYQKCDVRSDVQIEDLFKATVATFGGAPAIVINLAGMIHETEWSTTLDINIGGNIRCISSMLKFSSKENGGPGGVYMGMASICGLRGDAFGPVYCASKHAVVGLCRSWGNPEHLERHGIRFNCVCPTTIDTGFLQQVRNAYLVEENLKFLQRVDRLSPANVVEGFLLGIDDVKLNGQAIRVTKAHGVDLVIFQDTPKQ